MLRPRLLLACLIPVLTFAQQTVTIKVNAGEKTGALTRAWTYFGYDEPNYTYAKNGRRLIAELSALSETPIHIRTHFLLATGDGTGGLKWGSTNAYTEDAVGKPLYDWTIVDRILSTLTDSGVTPFVEIGFMPQALSTHPEPYTPNWIPGAKNDQYYIGWTYPPRDYSKWSELVYQWVKHCIEKYGKTAVEAWDWEVWNEPDIAYWHGTPEEYDQLYDYTAAAVKLALPSARVGGPASTGPANAKAAEFLRQFLEHCANGRNHATGEKGAPLDFISFHVKGRPRLSGDHVQMGLAQELRDAAQGFDIVSSFGNFRHLPIVLSEADPEGCAACSARQYPQNAYRNGPMYAAYDAAAIKGLLALAERNRINLRGILTWAFEFENQPYFAGFRTLATNGVDKPVLNLFRMLGIMRGDRLTANSSDAVSPESILHNGVAEHSDVDALAARSEHSLTVLVWNYRDEDIDERPADIDLQISGLPQDKRILLHHYRIDGEHSNAYALWKQMNSPQNPDPVQYARLEAAGHLQLLHSPEWLKPQTTGIEHVRFSLPLSALSLLELSW